MNSKTKYTVIILSVLLLAVIVALIQPVRSLVMDLQQFGQSVQTPTASVPTHTTATKPAATQPVPTHPTTTYPVIQPTEPTQPSVTEPTEPTVPETEPTVPPTAIPCTHTYEASVVAPTCVAPGYTHYVCSLCGDSYDTDFTEPGDHSFGQWVVETEPGCEVEGTEICTCIHCGEYQTRSVEAIGHSYGNWEIAEEPTCTREGLEVSVCIRCADQQTKIIEAKGHNYGSWQTAREPSCTVAGVKERSCKRCGDVQQNGIDATGHSYDTGVMVKPAASCKDKGVKRYGCKNCDYAYEVSVAGDHHIICRTCDELSVSGYNVVHDPNYKNPNEIHQIGCRDCDFGFIDIASIYLQEGKIDENSALLTDTIKIKDPEYVSVLATWPERWHEFAAFTQCGIMYGSWKTKDGNEGGKYEYRVWEIGSYEEAVAVLEDYNEFVSHFTQVYKWKPVEVQLEYDEEHQYAELYYIDTDQYKTYNKQKKKLSDAEKAEVAEEVIGYTIEKWGLRDGMPTANILEYIYYMIWSDVAYYDQSLRYHSAFDGFAAHTCVCDGYSEMFLLYADALGIQAEEVTGTMYGVGHAWNRVIFSDGSKWHLDITNGPILITDEELREMGYKWKK